MKAPECKIKKQLPPEELPAYLRRLADALENKTDHLPEELTDLPAPVAKIEIKGKGRDGAWELKLKIKGEPLAEQEEPADDTESSNGTASETKVKYKPLKKRMKSAFKEIGEALEANRLPAPETVNTFLADSDRMLTFTGRKYGEPHYFAYQSACRQLGDAYAAKNWEWFNSAYASLNQLMHDCHKEYK